jgi:hypothetical protein
MLDTIRQAWSWIGLDPKEIVASNLFGNMIVRAVDGSVWRICPEHLSCIRIAWTSADFAALSKTDEFRLDWQMDRLVELAERKFGSLSEGQCYCLKLPAVIGGKYDEANLGTISLAELISFSGYLAGQIKDVADGDQIQFEIVPPSSH